jgi:hypothetical protein
MYSAKPPKYLHNRLRVRELEKAFTRVAIDVKEILVLDGIDTLEDFPGFRIQCHDLYGPLPDAVIEDTGDRYPVLDRIISEAAKRIAMARLRQNICQDIPGLSFPIAYLNGYRLACWYPFQRQNDICRGAEPLGGLSRLNQKGS